MISIRFMVMNIIVWANKKEFQEVKEMCEALEELMYEELEEKRRLGYKRDYKKGYEKDYEREKKE